MSWKTYCSEKFRVDSHDNNVLSASFRFLRLPSGEAKETPIFKLPAYDPTAIALLGFGILAALSLLFIILIPQVPSLTVHSRCRLGT
jgi:hypothetical protein